MQPDRQSTGAGAAVTTATDDDDLLELERQVCFALAVASRSVIGIYRPVLEPLRLTHPQYLVMLALWQHAPLRVSELGRLLALEPATLSPLLKRLESVGYLERRRDQGDERALRLTLTPAGAALRARALEVPRTVMRRLQLDLAGAERLHAVLTDVIDRARQAGAEGAVPASGPGGLPLD
ncbi:DNA-binding transcriptional regulator, MarR family [Friedmanniella luteola]|uniref:DNA-binding transcriptional regulator, MarR family n=1 Tax=Friedmanniella luteola TaxID=546871 RepID=A0A1H1ZXR6_9ACTN|nr:MarR family transcriptional regulator [Friedmanniella luteola]SDT38601.1 DNA-binding transcriptional regulator, MarR family [Friedmanniella luteola]